MSNFTAIDFETATGKHSSICQVGIVIVEDCKIVERISYLVKPPDNEYSQRNIEIHGITPDKTETAETFDKIYPKIHGYIEGKKVVAHNAIFDLTCLKSALILYKIPYPTFSAFCTYRIYDAKLAVACERIGIAISNHHRALSDAEACALLMIKDIQK
jgi:DNA polymerase III subunit epsilon